MVQFCCLTLYVANLPGIKYINGIVFGLAEVLAMPFTGFLMTRFNDITAFRVCYFTGVCGVIVLISFAGSSWLPFIGVTLLNMSIGGWFNC